MERLYVHPHTCNSFLFSLAVFCSLLFIVSPGAIANWEEDYGSYTVMFVNQNTTLPGDYDNYIFYIAADDITLDLDGHTITGPGYQIGICLIGRSNVTIDGRGTFGLQSLVRNYSTGIYIEGGSENTVIGIVAYQNGRGFYLTGGTSDNEILLSVATTSTNHNVFIQNTTGNYFHDFYSVYGYNDGSDEDDGDGTEYIEFRSNGNAQNGIEIDNATNYTLTSCTGNYNGQHGMSLSDNSTDGVATSCVMNGNDVDGLHIRTGSTDNTFTSCSGQNNADENLDDDVGGNTYNSCYFP